MSLPGQTTINNIPLVGGSQVAPPHGTTGAIFFVGSTVAGASDDSSHGSDALTPFRTLAFAVGQASSGRGDTIYVMPGHVELIQAAQGVNLNVAGLHVIGLGQGRNRPLLQFASATLASLAFIRENTTLENCVLQLTLIPAVVAAISVQAADCALKGCEIIVSDFLGAAVLGLVTSTIAHRFLVEDCVVRGTAQAGTDAFFKIGGAPDGITIRRTVFIGQTAHALLWNATGNLATNLLVEDCEFHALAGTVAIAMESAVTGTLARVDCWGTALSGIIVPASLALFDVLGWDESVPGTQPVSLPTSGTSLPAGRSIVDELLGASLNAGRQNSFVVVSDFTSGTWNTVATHRVLQVAGDVRVRVIPLVTGSLSSGGAAQLTFGTATSHAVLIGPTDFTNLLAGLWWVGATAFENRRAYTEIFDQILTDEHLVLEILNSALTGGVIHWLVWWEPLTPGSTVQTGGGV